MAAGALFGRRFSAAEYGATALLSAGVALFTAADAASPDFAARGAALLALANAADALRLNLSEALMRAGRAPAELLAHAEGASGGCVACWAMEWSGLSGSDFGWFACSCSL